MSTALTPLGIAHTAISLVAVASAIAALIRSGHIRDQTRLGQTYLWTTVITCVTGFGIFQHGGFGVPHALGLLTLLVLGIAYWAGHTTALSARMGAMVASVAYSLTLFFHAIPGFTETSTRLPRHAPLASGPDDPNLQLAVGLAFGAFLIGAVLQVRDLRRRSGNSVRVRGTALAK